ncbi:hypothetical protein STEG23_012853, partial [Scotinomys teguina]
IQAGYYRQGEQTKNYGKEKNRVRSHPPDSEETEDEYAMRIKQQKMELICVPDKPPERTRKGHEYQEAWNLTTPRECWSKYWEQDESKQRNTENPENQKQGSQEVLNTIA